MSESFSFPLTPAVNQVVALPDGNKAKWNGYAWIGAPIIISGATTAEDPEPEPDPP